MSYLVDTNILLRIRHPAAPEYLIIRAALRRLHPAFEHDGGIRDPTSGAAA